MFIDGILKVKGNEEQITDKFVKREVVMETEEQYPQKISIQFTQDRTDLIDPVNVGEKIRIHFNIKGKEWMDPKTSTNRYFNTLDGWRVEKI